MGFYIKFSSNLTKSKKIPFFAFFCVPLKKNSSGRQSDTIEDWRLAHSSFRRQCSKFFKTHTELDNSKLGSTQQQKICWHWHVARIISSQKIYGLYARKHHKVEMRGDVTDAGQTTTTEDIPDNCQSRQLRRECKIFWVRGIFPYWTRILHTVCNFTQSV